MGGAPPPDAFGCVPSSPVRLLHIHGTHDEVVKYEGEPNSTVYLPYEGAVASAERYLTYNGCHDTSLPAGARSKEWYGMSGGADVVLWKVHGETHLPWWRDAYATQLAAW